jgi:IS5 family transposase
LIAVIGGHDEGKTRVLISGTRRGLTAKQFIDLGRRSAIEAVIGHMTDGRLSRCHPKGTIGDAIFTILNACGHNIRKILAHLRAWLAWIIAVLWTSEIPQNRPYLTADAA